MGLKSPATLALAWVVVPAIVTAACAGLGAGLGKLCGLRLAELTIPAGFLVGIVVMVLLLQLGLDGAPVTVVCLLLAVAGGAFAMAGRRQSFRAAFAWNPAVAVWVFPAFAGLFAYAAGLAPLAGSGHSGVLGYTLNNDPSVHLAAIELLRDAGTSAREASVSSYDAVSGIFHAGYPLGSHVWALFGATLTNLESFHVWSPLTAVYMGFLALALYALLREMDAPPLFAGVAGAVVGIGYLPYSYLAQGGAKELAIAAAVYSTLALLVRGVRQAGLTFRALLPPAIGSAASVAIFGLGALAWLGPPALVTCGVLLWRAVPRGGHMRALAGIGAALLVAALAALPSLIDAIQFIREFNDELSNPFQTGNLVGAVPLREILNVWLAYDYRLPTPDKQFVTTAGVTLAAVLAVVGVAYSVWIRRWAVPLALLAGGLGALLITKRYAIYFDAKAYMVLAPAVGLATATGVLALVRAGRAGRIAGLVCGIALAMGVIASDALVYAGAWVTPKDRFDELIQLGERYRGQGPMLVNEREDYAKLFLRDAQPAESWGAWQSDRGFRFGPIPPPPPRTPDFDDYRLDFMAQFKLLIQLRRPLGSAPPSNFRLVDQTPHYDVWKREGPMPLAHASIGIDTLSGSAPLACDFPEVADLIGRAKSQHRSVLVSRGLDEPQISPADTWQQYGGWFAPGPAPGEATRRGGVALTYASIKPGEYDVWIQGSFGPGLSLVWGQLQIGTAYGDLGLHSGWTELGRVRFTRKPDLVVVGGHKPWWQAGSERLDTTGPIVFVPVEEKPRFERVPPSRIDSLCGRRVDWLELTAAG